MKEIKDFPGYYITEDGQVYSGLKNNDYNDLKELKLCKNTSEYLYVSLYKNKTQSNKLVHRLVAETYIENPNNLPQVNHIDEDKTNNHVSNLEWISHQKNSVYSLCRWIWSIENIKTGEIVEIINMREFARDNNLSQGSLLKTLTGIRNHHKNFRIISKTQFK